MIIVGFTTLDYLDPVCGAVPFHTGQLGSQMLHALCLGKPFGLDGIAFHRFGRVAGFTLAHRERVRGGGGQPLLDGGDRRPQLKDKDGICGRIPTGRRNAVRAGGGLVEATRTSVRAARQSTAS
jgi:hypothetical protein